MNLTRRALLQQTSLALASVGLSQVGLSRLTRRYQQVLATPTSRKLALLIGINQYADEVCGFSSAKGTVLQGATTDVALHRELLVSRFGFHPSDIVTLLDQQATRDGIETALQFHLLDQVKNNDIVVFHFSGLGSYVRFSSQPVNEGDRQPGLTDLHPTLVPVDGTLPTRKHPELNDFLQATLASCLNALPTKNIVTLLDIGYQASSPLLGNLRMRSRLNPLNDVTLDDDSALRRRLIGERNQEKGINALPTPSKFSGALLVGANSQGIGAEAQWDGFSAGVLTYAFTQRLWKSTASSSIQTTLKYTSSAISQLVGRYAPPTFSGSVFNSKSPRPVPAYARPVLPESIDGVVTDVDAEKDSVELWLGGLAPVVLEHCSDASYLECLLEPPAEQGDDTQAFVLLQGRSRNGLNVTAERVASVNSTGPVDAIVPGSLIQEKVRSIPKDITLVVAIDHDLERIERVDATSALSAISKVTSATAGDQMADCLFGRLTAAERSSFTDERDVAATDDPLEAGDVDISVDEQRVYGIFRPGRSLIANTMGLAEEAVKTSIHRVTPQLQNLLAAKFLQLTENQAGSRLDLEITLETVGQSSQTVVHQVTARADEPSHSQTAPKANDWMARVYSNDQIQYRLHNYSSRALYTLLVSIDSRGNMTALCPTDLVDPSTSSSNEDVASFPETSLIPSQAEVTMPSADGRTVWTVGDPPGIVTTYVIASAAPFTETVNRFPKLKQSISDARTMVALTEPLDVVHAVLKDLHNASQPIVERMALEPSGDRYALDMGCWATFNVTYSVFDRASQDIS